MIEAVIRNGSVELLEAVPPDWADGLRVVIDRSIDADNNVETTQNIDQWYEEWCRSAEKLDSAEHQKFLQVIEEHRQEQKALMLSEQPLWPST